MRTSQRRRQHHHNRDRPRQEHTTFAGSDKQAVWVGSRRLLRLPADRDDVGRRLPYLFIAQDVSPCRHAEAFLLSAIGNRLKDVLGFELALRQIDPASAVIAMTMGTLLGQKEIMARCNHFRVFKVRNVWFRGCHLSNENSRNDHHPHNKCTRHAKHPTIEREERPGVGRSSLLTSPISKV
jgi:hypothetical protein